MFLTERRHHSRKSIALALRLQDGRQAHTVNVCEAGLYVVVPAGVKIDEWSALELPLRRGGLRLRAMAQVVRVDDLEHGTGIALRLHRPRLLCLANYEA